MFFSVVVVIVGIAVLILIHELGHFLAAKFFRVPVEEFGFGFPPRIWSKKIGETRYSFNWLPLGGFVRLHGEFESLDSKSFVNQKAWKRATILLAGVVMNFLMGWLLLSIVLFIGSPPSIVINDIVPNSVASRLDLRAGDQIVNFATSKDFVDFIKTHQGQSITFKVLRKADNKIQELEIKTTPKGDLGVLITDLGLPAHDFISAIGIGFLTSVGAMWSILLALGNIFTAPQTFIGPVGIFNIAIETGRLGLIYVMQLIALISLNLAILNSLPVPALDGGRLFFVILEKIRGKRFSPTTEMRANAVGFIVLISLIVFVTFGDIFRLLA